MSVPSFFCPPAKSLFINKKFIWPKMDLCPPNRTNEDMKMLTGSVEVIADLW